MNARAWLIALLLTAATGSIHAADWQVVLLKPPGCNVCLYLEEGLKRRSQLRTAEFHDGAGGQVQASIQRRTPVELTAAEWSQLRALPNFDEPLWRQQAAANAVQVLLKRDGVIVSAGNITDSTDSRTAQFPAGITTPQTGSDVFAVRDARSEYTGDLYLRSWDLNWFYRLALDPALLHARNIAWLARSEPLSPPLGSANVLLMSTASGAADNEIFNALRIEEIRQVLSQSLALEPSRVRVFYGSGIVHGANALEVRDGRYGLIRRDVEGAAPFSADAVGRIFQSIRASSRSRNLLVLVGHGNADGAGMWGSPIPLSPTTLRALHQEGGGDDVLVSGNCFGGVMARAVSCGFFGARPDIIATGCQADAAEVAQSRDYLHMFFSSLEAEARKAADADGDGAVSFAEAHWYASSEGDVRNVTYTSIDALADAYFDLHPEALPRSLSVRDMQSLAKDAAPAEARTLLRLLGGLDADQMLSLEDLAGQAMRWKPGSGLPRALTGQLARRLLFLKSSAAGDPELARLQSCENRSLAGFLKP